MVYTKEITFSIKANIGNYETIELSQSIALEECEKEKESEHFANLFLSINKRLKFIIKSFGRENDAKLFSKLIDDNKNIVKPIIKPKESIEKKSTILDKQEPVFFNNNMDNLRNVNDFLNSEEYNSNIKSPSGDINNVLNLEIPEI
jgi:hypothetical protein